MSRHVRWLTVLSLLAILSMMLVACVPAAAPAPAAGGSKATDKVEMFSWWTAGGEADGLNAMYDIYKKAIPERRDRQRDGGRRRGHQRQGGSLHPPDRRRSPGLLPAPRRPRSREVRSREVPAAAGRTVHLRGLGQGLPQGPDLPAEVQGPLLGRAGQHPSRQRDVVQQEGLRGQQPQAAHDLGRVLQGRARCSRPRASSRWSSAPRKAGKPATPSRRSSSACWARTATRACGPARRSGPIPR